MTKAKTIVKTAVAVLFGVTGSAMAQSLETNEIEPLDAYSIVLTTAEINNFVDVSQQALSEKLAARIDAQMAIHIDHTFDPLQTIGDVQSVGF